MGFFVRLCITKKFVCLFPFTSLVLASFSLTPLLQPMLTCRQAVDFSWGAPPSAEKSVLWQGWDPVVSSSLFASAPVDGLSPTGTFLPSLRSGNRTACSAPGPPPCPQAPQAEQTHFPAPYTRCVPALPVTGIT